MPYASLLHPELLSLWQSTPDCTGTGDAQTQFCLSLCGVPGSWCAQGFICALQESVSPVLCKFLEKAMAPHSSILPENPMDGGAWKAAVHGVAEGQTRLSDFTFTFHFHALEKEMATHSIQCSCLENPRDGEAWWAAVYGVAQSQTRLKRLSSSSSSVSSGNSMVGLMVTSFKRAYAIPRSAAPSDPAPSAGHC